jgi:hypothetical protein
MPSTYNMLSLSSSSFRFWIRLETNSHSGGFKFLRNFQVLNQRSYWALLWHSQPFRAEVKLVGQLRSVEVVCSLHIRHNVLERFILRQVQGVHFCPKGFPLSRSSFTFRSHLSLREGIDFEIVEEVETRNRL